MKKIILILCLLFLVGCNKGENVSTNVNDKVDEPIVEEPVIEEPKFYSPLTGLEISEDETDKRIYAIMFDNHPKAVPQSGIGEADIIYEFKAEGEFTRYMGLFYNHLPNMIGPVRSARPYFINTAKSFDGIYIHWGASEKAYSLLRSGIVEELDGIYLEGSTFFRNKEVKKRAPHNGYTNDELLKEQFAKKGFSETSNVGSFYKFVDDETDVTTLWSEFNPVESYKLNIFPTYNITFKYNEDSEKFNVYRGENIVVDERSDTPIEPVNVIVLFVKSRVAGALDTLDLDFTGIGDGKYLCNGKVMDITWERDSDTSKTVYKNLQGEEISLIPGQTFIEVVDPNTPSTLLPEIVVEEVETEVVEEEVVE